MMQDKRKTREQILMAKRLKRKPLAGGDALVMDKSEKEAGFSYRFVNDIPGRVQKYLASGYEVVEGLVETKTPQVGDASQLGTVVRPHVGGGMNAVLMRIETELKEEDDAVIQAKTDRTEEALHEFVKGGTKIEPTLPVKVGAGRY